MSAQAIVKSFEMQRPISRIEGFGTFRNSCRGGFDTSKGPWVKGRNWIEIVCSELTEFKNALIDAVGVNETEGEKPTVKTFYNVALDDYDVIRLGDEISVGGVNLAPDPEKAPFTGSYITEFVGTDPIKRRFPLSAPCRPLRFCGALHSIVRWEVAAGRWACPTARTAST